MIATGLPNSRWSNPPKAKIYEALSAMADGRVELIDDFRAKVSSSSGDKSYTVEWSADLTKFSSNDNASYWQGYLGYPIIAVLIALDRLTVSNEILLHLAGIPWKVLNQRHKNDYESAVASALGDLRKKGVDVEMIVREADRLYEEVIALGLEQLARKRSPP